MARHLREDSTGLSPVWQILAVVVVTGALIGAFYYFYVQHPPPAGGPRRVEPWDTAEIGYVGTFADDGRVFDTAYARVVMNGTAFQDKYGTRALDGLVVRDPFWGWNATVSLSGNVVTVTNSPFLGEKVRPYGAWDALVAGIDDAANNGTGIVYVQHDLAPDDARDILAHDGSDQFIVTSVDLDKGVYVADYNREVVGRTLVFDITIASIIRK